MFEPNPLLPIPWTQAEYELRPKGTDELAWVSFLREFKIGAASNNDIMFFGKIVDESGKPLGSVSLSVRVSGYETDLKTALKTNNDLAENRTITLKTDDKGRFSVSGESGNSIKIEKISKNGYELQGRKKYYTYDFLGPRSITTHKPDKEKPVVFTMTATKE